MAAFVLSLLATGPAAASMIGSYRQISPQQLEELKRNPDGMEALLSAEATPDDMAMDVDKAWNGLHYVLTGTAEGGQPPLSQAVLGGTEIGGDVGYGPARFLTPEQVRQVAQALAGLDEAALRAKYNPAAMKQAGVYPEEIWEDAESFDYLLENFASLSIFFQDASARGNAVLFYLN
jgi:hypothetical protein